MLHRPMSRALSFGAACLALAAWPGPVPADVYFETAYLPTSSVVSLQPTSYVVPTSYLPTSYVATSAVMASESVAYPTTTTYVRRSILRPRRYVERSYYSYPVTSTSYLLPTSYVSSTSLLPTTYVRSSSLLPTTYVSSSTLLPTTYVSRSYIAPTSFVVDNDVIVTSASSSSYPCETSTSASSPSKPPTTRPSGSSSGDSGSTITSRPSNGGMGDERRPQGVVNAVDEGPSSAVVPEPVKVPSAKPDTPPAAPMPEPDTLKPSLPEPGKLGEGASKPAETSFRTARRPNYDGRNILRGKVISAESRLPEEGVTVILSNVTKAFADKLAMSDADGEFKVSLPDGDWVVKVKMPSGTVYPVGRDYFTASNGRITDPSGRPVPEFRITR